MFTWIDICHLMLTFIFLFMCQLMQSSPLSYLCFTLSVYLKGFLHLVCGFADFNFIMFLPSLLPLTAFIPRSYAASARKHSQDTHNLLQEPDESSGVSLDDVAYNLKQFLSKVSTSCLYCEYSQLFYAKR